MDALKFDWSLFERRQEKNGTYTWIIWSKQKSHWLRLLLLFQNYIFACLVHNDDKTFKTHAHLKCVYFNVFFLVCFFCGW